MEVSPSARPGTDTPATAPLVPIPPRFAVWLGMTYSFGRPVPVSAPAPAPTRSRPLSPPPPPPDAARPAAGSVTLVGHVSAPEGGKLADVRVEVIRGDAHRAVPTTEDGRFSIDGAPGEELTIVVEAGDHLPRRVTITLHGGDENTLDLPLERRSPRGQIRALIRSLRGTPVAAEVVVEGRALGPSDGGAPKAGRAEGGRFEVDVVPGTYFVTISAPGYEVQKRKVEVEENGVTLLNVDLRRER